MSDGCMVVGWDSESGSARLVMVEAAASYLDVVWEGGQPCQGCFSGFSGVCGGPRSDCGRGDELCLVHVPTEWHQSCIHLDLTLMTTALGKQTTERKQQSRAHAIEQAQHMNDPDTPHSVKTDQTQHLQHRRSVGLYDICNLHRLYRTHRFPPPPQPTTEPLMILPCRRKPHREPDPSDHGIPSEHMMTRVNLPVRQEARNDPLHIPR